MALGRQKVILLAAGLVAAVAVAATWALTRRSDPADSLRSNDPKRQQEAISALRADRDTPQGMQGLAQAVGHRDAAVACMALRAIAAGRDPSKPLEPEGLEVVRKAAADPRPQVRHTAIRVLEATTPPAPEDPTVPELLLKLFLTETSPQTRAAAANALGKLQYWPAVEPLLEALEDESVTVRGAAGAAIRKILGLDFGFRASDPPQKRAADAARIREHWKLQLPFHMDYVRRLRERRRAKP
jgi:HEAT repeat protein